MGKQTNPQRLTILDDSVAADVVGQGGGSRQAIIWPHPFVDGNTRTAAMYVVAYLLEKLGYKLEAEQNKLEDFVVQIA